MDEVEIVLQKEPPSGVRWSDNRQSAPGSHGLDGKALNARMAKWDDKISKKMLRGKLGVYFAAVSDFHCTFDASLWGLDGEEHATAKAERKLSPKPAHRVLGKAILCMKFRNLRGGERSAANVVPENMFAADYKDVGAGP
jgi:hypothetical protein